MMQISIFTNDDSGSSSSEIQLAQSILRLIHWERSLSTEKSVSVGLALSEALNLQPTHNESEAIKERYVENQPYIIS